MIDLPLIKNIKVETRRNVIIILLKILLFGIFFISYLFNYLLRIIITFTFCTCALLRVNFYVN